MLQLKNTNMQNIEIEAKNKVTEYKNKGLITLTVGLHGNLFCQVLNKGNYFKKMFDNYNQVLNYLTPIFN